VSSKKYQPLRMIDGIRQRADLILELHWGSTELHTLWRAETEHSPLEVRPMICHRVAHSRQVTSKTRIISSLAA
jgi:hypothetical protein